MLSFRDYLRTNRSNNTFKKGLERKFNNAPTGMYTATIPPDEQGEQEDDGRDQFVPDGARSGNGAVNRFGSPFVDVPSFARATGSENQEDEDIGVETQDLVPETPPEDRSYNEEPVPNNGLSADVPDVEQDPNRQGLIRVVPAAHLIYKRRADDGTYEELWTFEISRVRDGNKTRENILAGTDIQPTKVISPDGSQTLVQWTSGNRQILQIKGLPN